MPTMCSSAPTATTDDFYPGLKRSIITANSFQVATQRSPITSVAPSCRVVSRYPIRGGCCVISGSIRRAVC
jgi:hypothetical protein